MASSLDDDLKDMLSKFQKEHEPYLHNAKKYIAGGTSGVSVGPATTTTAASVLNHIYADDYDASVQRVTVLEGEVIELKKRIVELGEMIALLHIMMGVENKKQ